MHRIAITNMTGARNRGCDALVSSILIGLDQAIGRENLLMSLHTRDLIQDSAEYAGWLRQAFETPGLPRAHWPVARQRTFFKAMQMLPTGLKRGHRLAAFADLAAADLLIATGGDVFTSDYNGLANHARTLQVGTPVALLAQTIGPFTADAEKHFAASIDNVAICTVRESETLAYLQDRFPQLAVEQTADVAFLLPPTPADQARHILEVEHRFPTAGKRLVGLSVSAGILSYRKDVDSDVYVREVAAFVDDLNERGFSVVLIPHVQERARGNNDLFACRAVLNACRDPAANMLLSLPILTASDYKGVIGLCEALVGARTHATIASMSQGVPTVSIAYSRKAWGIMRDYYGTELGTKLTVDVAEMDRERLIAAFDTALANGLTETTATEMKRRAAINFDRVRTFLE